MPKADGSVTIRTDLDNSQLEKEYAKTVKKIGGMERDISAKQARKSLFEKSSADLSAQLDGAKRKLDEMQSAAQGVFSEDAIKTQEETVASLQSRWNDVQSQVEKYEKQIADATEKLEAQKAKAAGLADVIDQSAQSSKKLGISFDGVKKRIKETSNQIFRLTTQMLAFSLIHTAMQSIQNYMSGVISTNDQASASLARLQGALLSMIQPLVSVVIPAFTTFVNILTAVIGKIAAFVAMLGGTTVEGASSAAKALNDEAKAISGAGAAAKKASKSLAGFDEINRLDSADASGGGGGGGASAIEPDFSWADGVTDDLSRIADYILLIGAGLALWKIGEHLPGVLGTIATTVGGLLITLGGVMLMWDGVTDALENGVDWMNLLEMVGGLAVAAGGLYIAFGSVAAGIALIAGGLVLLVTGFQDAMKSGFNLQNTLLTIAGIFATGLGITLLTGSLIPVLVGAIAGLLLALTVATGHGGEMIEGVQEICQGFVDFFTGIFSGDIEKTLGGIELMFSGLGKVVGSVILGVRDSILSFLDWLDEKTGGKLSGIIGAAKGLVTGFFDMLLSVSSGTIAGLQQIFSGLIKFISGVFSGNWKRAWEGLKDVFKGIWNGVISILEGAANLIIDGVNWIIKQINKISVTIPSWVPGIGGSYFGPNITPINRISLPRLAEGAVIPPNSEFLAVLGDQRHGTNIEAPLSTIQEAVAIVMEDMIQSNIAGHEATVEMLRQILEAVYSIDTSDERYAEAVDNYRRKMAVARGAF